MRKPDIQKSDDLRKRVNIAKATLKIKGCKNSKIAFFDKCYGKMLKRENIRLDNLWATYTTNKQFTVTLEKFSDEYKS